MNYRKHYNTLISRSREREKIQGKYYEKHHIILRAEGGSDEESNTVFLTAREHFVAHWLLYREDPTSYVRAEAFRMMCDIDPSVEKKRYTPSSRAVSEAREASARLKSQLYRKKCWVKRGGEQKFIFKEEVELYEEAGWSRGRNYSPSQETREKLRQSRLNEAPRGKEFNEKMSKIVSERYKTDPGSWKKSPEAKQKLSKIASQKWESEDFRKQFSETRQKSRTSCTYCGKQGNYNIMKRWHFENCKDKKK